MLTETDGVAEAAGPLVYAEPWTSRNGLVLPDRVPAALRAEWIEQGHCPGRDLYSLFRERVAAHPDRTAVIAGDVCIDYAGLDAAARRLAARLRHAGLGQDDVIALSLPNGWRALAAELAVSALGAVALTYPVGTGRADARALVRAARAAVVLTEDLVRGLLPVPYPRAASRAPDLAAAETASHSPARMLVSSGSESVPKAVAYSHDAMAGGRGNYVAALFGSEPPPRILVLVQLASSYGSLGLLSLLRCGAALILPPGRFNAGAAMRAVIEHRPTHVCAVPTMLARMVRLPGRAGTAPFDGLSALISSGAPLSGEVLAACWDRFGVDVVNVYGSSDGVNCRARWKVPQGSVAVGAAGAGASSVGRPDPGVVSLVVADRNDRPLPAGSPGQILARGPMSPLCHVGDSGLDARQRTVDGWVRSGDLGVFEPDGTLVVLDRIKRVVKRGGYSVSPAQLEAAAAAHPAIAEAACVPLPDPDLGQRLCLCVALRMDADAREEPAAPTLAGLRAFLEGERGLARHALPDALLVLPALPHGATGKVCLKTLTQHVAAAHRPGTARADRTRPGPVGAPAPRRPQ